MTIDEQILLETYLTELNFKEKVRSTIEYLNFDIGKLDFFSEKPRRVDYSYYDLVKVYKQNHKIDNKFISSIDTKKRCFDLSCYLKNIETTVLVCRIDWPMWWGEAVKFNLNYRFEPDEVLLYLRDFVNKEILTHKYVLVERVS